MSAYRHILVATDGSALSLRGAMHAVQLAKDLNARVTAVYVVAPPVPAYADAAIMAASPEYPKRVYEEQSRLEAKNALDTVRAIARSADVDCEELSFEDGEPWERIIDAARDKKCDLIVMASHGRGNIGSLLLGSQTREVLTHSSTPVLVCH